jgi:thymidylate synthase (FAD)
MTKIPVLDKGFVRLVDHMGSDLTVVNAARVSFAKESKWIYPTGGTPDCFSCGWCEDPEKGRVLHERDARLIRYLAKHEHWTPFGHPQITLHFKWPIFVARQAMRSNIGICWNEVSRRYVDDTPEFYEPKVWRKRPDGSIKQGSGEEFWPYLEDFYGEAPKEYGHNPPCHPRIGEYQDIALMQYNELLAQGAAPEMARMVLPQSTYTEAWGTFSLAALARFYKLRADSHAQLEIQEFAHAIDSLVCPMFPVSWAALTNKE